MKFGTMNLLPLGSGESDHEMIEQAIEDAVLADQMGFDSIWLAEHHFSRYGILGNPLMLAGAIAQRTKHIEIGTAVMVVPFYPAIRLAEDAALVDILSGGRLRLGVGRGYQPREFNGFGIDANEKVERYQECIDILKLAWSGENWSYEGKYNRFKNMNVFPKPLRGSVPILHAAVQTPSFLELGRAGERIITSPNFTPLKVMRHNFQLYDQGLAEAGRERSAFERPFMQQAWCGDGEDGRLEAAEAAHRYYRMVGQIIPGAGEDAANLPSAQIAYYEKVRRGIDRLTVEQTLSYGGNFGSVQQVVDAIHILQQEMGVDHYICWFRIPTLARATALRAMERFARDVIPAFKAAASGLVATA
jgi:alkanesulfonate monooxygenase SsuD/methylene tetrahydromethanopterin reductase-like flavin-dependent oxidoreductase (luciferase family)